MEMHVMNNTMTVHDGGSKTELCFNDCPKCGSNDFLYGWEHIITANMPDCDQTSVALHELRCNDCGNYMRVLGYSPLGQELLADKWNNQ